MHFKLVLMISWHKFRWFYFPLTTCFFLRRGYQRDFFILRGSRLWKTLNRCDLIIFSSVRRHGRTLLFYTKKIAFSTGTKTALSKLSLISNIVKQRDTVGENIIIACLSDAIVITININWKKKTGNKVFDFLLCSVIWFSHFFCFDYSLIF